MFKNFWYAVAFSHEVTAAPRAVTVMGISLVLWRRADGAPVVQLNRCPHRGAALHIGRVVGDQLECPYHGWLFNQEGAATAVPSGAPGGPVPTRARLETWPVAEQAGFVWAFLGDLPESERPPLPDVPEHRDPTWRMISGEFLWNAHYTRVVENAVDIAHAPFVHAGSFGNPDLPQVPPHEVEVADWSVSAAVDLDAPPPGGLWSFFRRDTTRRKVGTRVTVYLPTHSRLDLRLYTGWRMVIFSSNVPVDATHTLTKWTMYRDFFTGSWADADSRKRTLQIFREDQPIVESQRPMRVPDGLSEELHVKADALQLAVRRLNQKATALGWALASPPSEGAETRPMSFPCPAHRTHPEGWTNEILPARVA